MAGRTSRPPRGLRRDRAACRRRGACAREPWRASAPGMEDMPNDGIAARCRMPSETAATRHGFACNSRQLDLARVRAARPFDMDQLPRPRAPIFFYPWRCARRHRVVATSCARHEATTILSVDANAPAPWHPGPSCGARARAERIWERHGRRCRGPRIRCHSPGWRRGGARTGRDEQRYLVAPLLPHLVFPYRRGARHGFAVSGRAALRGKAAGEGARSAFGHHRARSANSPICDLND